MLVSQNECQPCFLAERVLPDKRAPGITACSFPPLCLLSLNTRFSYTFLLSVSPLESRSKTKQYRHLKNEGVPKVKNGPNICIPDKTQVGIIKVTYRTLRQKSNYVKGRRRLKGEQGRTKDGNGDGWKTKSMHFLSNKESRFKYLCIYMYMTWKYRLFGGGWGSVGGRKTFKRVREWVWAVCDAHKMEWDPRFVS